MNDSHWVGGVPVNVAQPVGRGGRFRDDVDQQQEQVHERFGRHFRQNGGGGSSVFSAQISVRKWRPNAAEHTRPHLPNRIESAVRT